MKRRSILFLLSFGMLLGNAVVHADDCGSGKEAREQKRLRDQARHKQEAAEKKAKAEKKKQEQERKKQECAAARERKRMEREACKRDKEAKARIEKEKKRLENERKCRMNKERMEAELNHREAYRESQKRLAMQWKEMRHKEVTQEYQDGKYANLYKQPAWPTYATYVKHKHLFNIGTEYRYETDAYDVDGNNRDITILPFGQGPIAVKDILLVSKLISEHLLVPGDSDIGSANPQYFRQLADCPVVFLVNLKNGG
ncbi:hypothetical protein IPF37_05850 [bacterium]|nr:MAG: hypothetical protein IPF37_05850 [bacterium]